MTRFIRDIASLVLVGPVLLMGVPRLALGQDGPLEVKMDLDYRAGQEVRVRDLGEFLRDRFSLDVGDRDGEPVEVVLVIETISREWGPVGAHESRPSELQPGTRQSGASLVPSGEDWIAAWPDKWVEDNGATVVLGLSGAFGTLTARGMPSQCEGDTHAVRIALRAVSERSVVDAPLIICMREQR